MAERSPLRVPETAAELGVSEATARGWVERGVLRAYRLSDPSTPAPTAAALVAFRTTLRRAGGPLRPTPRRHEEPAAR